MKTVSADQMKTLDEMNHGLKLVKAESQPYDQGDLGNIFLGIDRVVLCLTDPRFFEAPATEPGTFTVNNPQRWYGPGKRFKGQDFWVGSHFGYTFVSFSIARIASGGVNNICRVNYPKINDIVDYMQCALLNIGIDTDVWQSRISHLEMFIDAAMPRPFIDYKPLLDLTYIPRRPKAIFPSMYSFKNKRWKDKFYCKRTEMMNKGDDINNVPQHFMRYELIASRGDAVRSLGVERMIDIPLSIAKLSRGLIDHLGKVLQGGAGSSEVVEQLDLDAFIDHRKEVQRALYAYALAKRCGGVEELRPYLKSRGWDRDRIGYFSDIVLEGLKYPLTPELVGIDQLRVELLNGFMQPQQMEVRDAVNS